MLIVASHCRLQLINIIVKVLFSLTIKLFSELESDTKCQEWRIIEKHGGPTYNRDIIVVAVKVVLTWRDLEQFDEDYCVWGTVQDFLLRSEDKNEGASLSKSEVQM